MRVARSAAADINFNAALAMHEKALTATKIANGKGKARERDEEREKEEEREGEAEQELNGRWSC